MRCVSCDFHVIWFDNYSWSDSCDYYFLRNNVPDFGRLKKKLNTNKGLVYNYMQGVHVPYTRIFSSDKNFEGLNYVGIYFRGLRTTC